MKGDLHDPKALIREAYAIEGITDAQCRSIFLDWALSLPASMDTQASLSVLVKRYALEAPDHPMSEVLKNGQQTMTNPKRRGGWRSRPRN
mgnify:CR=1 FL=1